jgi:hypothetical protein
MLATGSAAGRKKESLVSSAGAVVDHGLVSSLRSVPAPPVCPLPPLPTRLVAGIDLEELVRPQQEEAVAGHYPGRCLRVQAYKLRRWSWSTGSDPSASGTSLSEPGSPDVSVKGSDEHGIKADGSEADVGVVAEQSGTPRVVVRPKPPGRQTLM